MNNLSRKDLKGMDQKDINTSIRLIGVLIVVQFLPNVVLSRNIGTTVDGLRYLEFIIE